MLNFSIIHSGHWLIKLVKSNQYFERRKTHFILFKCPLKSLDGESGFEEESSRNASVLMNYFYRTMQGPCRNDRNKLKQMKWSSEI